MALINEVITELQSLNPSLKASLAEKYEIKLFTLSRRARDIITSKAITDSNKSLLSK